MSGMRCLVCGKAKMTRANSPVEAEYRGERFTVTVPNMSCPKCGYQSVDGKDLTEMMRLLADEYRRNHGLLTSLQVKGFREQRGETQKQFADYLRVGEASVKRWELGAIQDDAMDELIRLKCDSEKARENANRLAEKLSRPSLEERWAKVEVVQPTGSFGPVTSPVPRSLVKSGSSTDYAFGA